MPPLNSPQSPRSPAIPLARALDNAATAGTLIETPGALLQHDVPRPLTPLSYLSSPVTDLASTLRTMPQDERPRSRQNSHLLGHGMSDEQRHIPSTNTSHSFVSRISATDSENRERRQRLHRVMANMYRSANASGLAMPSSASAYGNRTPSPGRQDLYDWAPSASQLDAEQLDTTADPTQADNSIDYLENMVEGARLRRTPRPRDVTESNGVSSPGRSGLVERREERHEQMRDAAGISLRSRALLQRHREQTQHLMAGRTSSENAASRAAMEYRERSNISEEEERAREQGWIRAVLANANAAEPPRSATPSFSSRDPWPLPPPRGESRSQTSRENAIHRRLTAETMSRQARAPTASTLARSTPHASSPSMLLENSLNYLNELRGCDTYEDALGAAIEHNMATKEFFADKHDDFIMDLNEIDSFAETSWLQPGTTFSGHQHGASALSPTRNASPTFSIEQINPNHRSSPMQSFDHPPGSTSLSPHAGVASQAVVSQHPTSLETGRLPPYSEPSEYPKHDEWPVRVIIHAVDYEKMLIQGTMEAYDVPQNNRPGSLCNTTLLTSISTDNNLGHRPKIGKKSAPVRTYLEGHIIDLRTHSFLTPGSSDPSKSNHDAATVHGVHASGCPSLRLNNEVPFPAATPAADAANWRKLPPFSTGALSSASPPPASSSPSILSTNDDIARMLLSKFKLNRIHNEYIFMRWKERCFVHDDLPLPNSSLSSPSTHATAPATVSSSHETPSAAARNRNAAGGETAHLQRMKCPGSHVHGLTISGFYYVSMRRSDGRIEGLYYDPSSTPHQHLQLEPVNGVRMGWASCDLR